jgi:hypothetical protein
MGPDVIKYIPTFINTETHEDSMTLFSFDYFPHFGKQFDSRHYQKKK